KAHFASKHGSEPGGTYQISCHEPSTPPSVDPHHPGAVKEPHSGACRIQLADPTNRDRSIFEAHRWARDSRTLSSASTLRRLYTSTGQLVSIETVTVAAGGPLFEDPWHSDIEQSRERTPIDGPMLLVERRVSVPISAPFVR